MVVIRLHLVSAAFFYMVFIGFQRFVSSLCPVVMARTASYTDTVYVRCVGNSYRRP